MRAVTMNFSGAADGRALLIDRDTVLVGVKGSITVVVSSDPKATIANTFTTPGNAIVETTYAILRQAGEFQQLNYPLEGGSYLFVSSSAVNNVIFFFEDPV